MGQLLKQSTAVNITVVMIDSSDHVSGKTGLTLTIYASKAAGTPGAITPTVTELDSTHCPGLYKLALTTSHTDTIGELQLHVTSSGADPTDVSHQIVLDLPGVAQTGDSYARLGAPAGASVSADIAANYSRIGAPVGASISADIAANPGKAWDVTLSSHLTSGSTGQALNAAGASGDPWVSSLPGSYSSGQAGYIIGHNIDAQVSTRLASASYTAPDNSDIAAIKAKTDNLPAAPAATGDIPTANANADALLDRAAGVETNRTPRQALRLMLAALAGKLSGAATATVLIRDTNDTKNRITASVDADGNRSTVTYDAS
jgi:hypothetical protein